MLQTIYDAIHAVALTTTGAASLRRRPLEVVRELVKHLPHGLGGAPPSAEPATSGVGEPVLSADPRPSPLIHGGAGQAGAACNPCSFNERAEDPVEPDPRAAQELDVALSDYRTRRYTIGNQTFQFDKAGMRYVLERHAPDYWDGSQGNTQTFFPEGTTVEHLQDVVGGRARPEQKRDPRRAKLIQTEFIWNERRRPLQRDDLSRARH